MIIWNEKFIKENENVIQKYQKISLLATGCTEISEIEN